MKLLNKQIDMISWTSKEGVVTPVRFRIEEDGKSIVIRIGRILQTEKNMFGGTPTLSFRCAISADKSTFTKSLITAAVRNGS